ncbi:hypothetical protein CRP403_gp4 [Roseobacter phage CRP-403]|uniref:MarR family transcriptional regulator n=1 Tax=Roseobacter phage CRP-403 TaxID=3072849 RepID=A0AAX3ZWR7_9CAUD|nr:hypothetical protein CRP403_gp4 [Roseobacter phage CRP-403]
MDILTKAQRDYAAALFRYEFSQAKQVLPIDDPEEQKFADYGLSTLNRRYFLNAVTLAALNDKPTRPMRIAKLLGISRNAVDTMIDECHASGWITIDRDERGWRYIQATEFAVDIAVRYAVRMNEIAHETGVAQSSIRLKIITDG